MNTASSNLSVQEALESSLSFLGHFLKQHWLLAIVYIGLSAVPAFIIGDQDVVDISFERKAGLAIFWVANFVPALLLIDYSLRDALFKLDPLHTLSNRSLASSLWLIFCMYIVSSVIGGLLTLLLILPGVWWSTKATVSFANLLSTNDGVFASIKKSHQLMNGRFWPCLWFLFATSSAIGIVAVIAGLTIVFFLLIGGMLNAVFHEGPGLNRALMLLRLISPIFAFFTGVVCYYIQVWLYVYLKKDTAVPIVIA